MRVSKGVTVTVYSKSGWRGKELLLDQDVSFLGMEFNDRCFSLSFTQAPLAPRRPPSHRLRPSFRDLVPPLPPPRPYQNLAGAAGAGAGGAARGGGVPRRLVGPHPGRRLRPRLRLRPGPRPPRRQRPPIPPPNIHALKRTCACAHARKRARTHGRPYPLHTDTQTQTHRKACLSRCRCAL